MRPKIIALLVCVGMTGIPMVVGEGSGQADDDICAQIGDLFTHDSLDELLERVHQLCTDADSIVDFDLVPGEYMIEDADEYLVESVEGLEVEHRFDYEIKIPVSTRSDSIACEDLCGIPKLKFSQLLVVGISSA